LIVVSVLLAQERQARREADAARLQAEFDKAKAQTEATKSQQARHEADAARLQAELDAAKAETEAVKSQQDTRFLENMLKGVGPAVARGRDTTMLHEILDQTAENVGTEMTNQPAVEAELRSLIGKMYFEIGNYDQAEKMQNTALVIDRKLFGPESLEAAASLNDLGLTFSKEGDVAEAESAFQKAVAIRRQHFGNENADVADSLNALATVYRHERRLTESEAATREALGVRQKLFTDNSLEAADSLHNLCVVLGDEGKHPESEATARKMLAMRRKLLGPEDPLVAAALLDVAWAAGYDGKRDEAESLQREALAIQRKFLGDENPAVATTLSSLGQSVRERGSLTEADALLSAALSIQRKLLGETNPDFLYTLDSFGLTLEGEGKWREAEMVHREALTAWRKRGGNEDPHSLIESEGLVRALVAQKKFGGAKQFLDEALTPAFIKKPSSVNLLALRVDLLGRQGRWQEAVADATGLLKLQPTDHYSYHMLAGLLAVTDNRSDYEQLCQKILANFGNPTTPFVADWMAQDCLLLPHSGVDLQAVDKLADTAATVGTGDYHASFFQAGKAMSNYRLGRFSEAVEWGEKPLNGTIIDAQAKASAILAMAHWQLGQKEAARAMLARGDTLAPRISPAAGDVDLGDSWVAWLFARVSLDEATALIQSGSTTHSISNKSRQPVGENGKN
jgi:tetratricopeptide (TPR) repeat protein